MTKFPSIFVALRPPSSLACAKEATPSRRMLFTVFLFTLISTGLLSKQAGAGVVFNTNAGSDDDGPLAAKVEFVAVNGGIEVILTNTETGTFAKGQAISALSFSVNQS